MELRKDMFELNGKRYFKFHNEDDLYDSYQDEDEEHEIPSKEDMLIDRIGWQESMQRLLNMSKKDHDQHRNNNQPRK